MWILHGGRGVWAGIEPTGLLDLVVWMLMQVELT